jgi:hypothetical protein
MSLSRVSWGLLAASLVFMTFGADVASAQPAPAVSVTPGPSLTGGSGGIPITYGWQFRPTVDIEISRLGFADGAPYSAVGLHEPHDVGVFDSEGRLIVSARIPKGSRAVLEDGFWYVSIPPLLLQGGHVFTIGALLPEPKKDTVLAFDPVIDGPPSVTFDSRIIWLQGVSNYPGGRELAFPSAPCCGTLVGFFGPTFTIASGDSAP